MSPYSPMRRWTVSDLIALSELGRRGYCLNDLAEVWRHRGHTRADVDLALWALVGRSVVEAARYLGAAA